MPMIAVKWTATGEHDEAFRSPVVKNHATNVPAWACDDDDGAAVVQYVCERYFEHEYWVVLVGDEQEMTVRVRIDEPAALAGDYLVGMERVNKARARKLEAASHGARR